MQLSQRQTALRLPVDLHRVASYQELGAGRLSLSRAGAAGRRGARCGDTERVGSGASGAPDMMRAPSLPVRCSGAFLNWLSFT